MAIYIEHWEVECNPCGNRIDFAYSEEQREQGMVGFMRHEFFEENGVGAVVRLLHVDRIEDEPQNGLDRCYKCKWWNSSCGCKCKKGICEFEPIDKTQTKRSE